MKTNFITSSRFFTYIIALTFICCTKAPNLDKGFDYSTIASDSRDKSIEPMQPGVYTGEGTHLNNGVAYSWMEFKEVDQLDKVVLVLPMLDLEKQFAYQGSKNSIGTLEVSMPDTRGKSIFNQIIVTYTPQGYISEPYTSPHINFNFIYNNSPSNFEFDFSPDNAISRMPIGFKPLSFYDGCIPGVGLLWESGNNSYQKNQWDILLGSANSDLAFYSPMASTEVLANHQILGGSILLPPTMTPFRYYPRHYDITQVGNELHVTLDNFARKN